MGNPAAQYKIIGVGPARVIERKKNGAPAEGWLCEFGKKNSVPMVIRYYPSRKGWRILDLRRAQCFGVNGRAFNIWKGQVRGQRYWPTEDAAIAVAMHVLGYQPITD